MRPLEGPLYYGYSIECDTAKHACAFLAKALGNGDDNWVAGPNGGPGICSAVGTDHLGNPKIERIGPYCWHKNGVEQGDEENPLLNTGCGPPPPTISSDQPNLWWFNDPSLHPDEKNFPTEIELKAKPAGAESYDWKITVGANKIVFSDSNSDKITTTTNTVKVKSIKNSDPGTPLDISVTADRTVNGKTSLQSTPYQLTVLTPYQISPIGSICTQ